MPATMSLDDDRAIRNLVARYCLTTDNADADGFMACWVPPESSAATTARPSAS
jgi:hypothetical protein